MFAITIHGTIPDAIDIRCWGRWNVETALAFVRALDVAIGTLPCIPGQHLAINDIRDLATHPEEVVRLLADMFDRQLERHGPGLGIAMLVGPGAARAQNDRILDHRSSAAFETREAAERWMRARRAGIGLAA